MANLRGPAYLQSKLIRKRERVLTRYKYYEMKNMAQDLRISTPPQLTWFFDSMGWCAKAVDSLADRLQFKEFRGDDEFDLDNIFLMNNSDILFDSMIESALIASCCFVYVSPDDDGFPKLQVIDGSNATGILDPITYLLTEGYAVLERDSDGNITMDAYFEPGKTTYSQATEKGVKTWTVNSGIDYPLLVPIIYKPDAKRLFGHSRISRTCMDLQDSAMRTVKRSEISAEFYSFPQKYVTGLAQDAEAFDSWKATMSSLLAFTNDDDGNHPVLGQFQAQSMEPHLAQLRMFASMFAGETGLTLDDLGFATGNPSSSDAIKAAHENLRLSARKAQKYFARGFINVGMVAACMRDEFNYKRKAFYNTEVAWEPVFEPDGSSLSGTGDAIIKINQALPGYVTPEKFNDLTGI